MSDSESLSEILSGSSAFVPSTPAAKSEPATDVKPEVTQETAAPSAAKAEDKPAPEADAAEEPQEKPSRERDEHGRFKKAQAKESKPEPMVPLSALLAERAKRTKEPEAPKPKTSFLEDEDRAFQERASAEIAPLKQAIFQLSVELARTRYQDFDEVAKSFADAAEADPRLWDQMRDAPNPASYIYMVGTQIRELADVGGDIVRYREKVTAQTKAELEETRKQLAAAQAELEALKKAKADLDAVPRSLNSSPSGAAPKAGDDDPEDIKHIVRFGNNRG